MIWFDSCLRSEDSRNLLLALLYVLEMKETLPLMPFSKNKYMSASEITSRSTFVRFSIASQGAVFK